MSDNHYSDPNNNGSEISVIELVSSGCAWNGTEYEAYPAGKPFLTVLKMNIPAHTSLPWHTHDMPNAAYIISGKLYVEDRLGNTRVIKTGEAFNESVGNVHRGYTKIDPVEVVITYAGVKEQPLSNIIVSPSD